MSPLTYGERARLLSAARAYCARTGRPWPTLATRREPATPTVGAASVRLDLEPQPAFLRPGARDPRAILAEEAERASGTLAQIADAQTRQRRALAAHPEACICGQCDRRRRLLANLANAERAARAALARIRLELAALAQQETRP